MTSASAGTAVSRASHLPQSHAQKQLSIDAEAAVHDDSLRTSVPRRTAHIPLLCS